MKGVFERPLLIDQVEAHMTQKITDGEWTAGTILPPEEELAQQLGVSRTVVRESVRVLVSRGMLRVRQGRGTIVLPSTEWNLAGLLALLVRADRTDLAHWLEIRAIVEVQGAGLAAKRKTPEDESSLRQALSSLERAADGAVENPVAYTEADINLHLVIARASHNPVLVRLLHPIIQPLREHVQDRAALPENYRAATTEHATLVRHILAGDMSGARAAMAQHLNRVASEEHGVMSLDALQSLPPAVRPVAVQDAPAPDEDRRIPASPPRAKAHGANSS